MPFKLLSWGANTYGQLGLGLKSESCPSPMEVTSDADVLDIRDIISVTGGGGHTLIMDAKGAVFSCGYNSRGQLGRNDGEGEDHKDPKIALITMEEEDHAIQIACGWDSSYCVTWFNKLLVWGSNAYGQLGLPKKEYPKTDKPIKVPDLNNVERVAAGLRHVLLLTKDGHVMACGCGKKGQLGILDDSGEPLKELEQFREVPELSNIVQVACGQNFSAALDKKGLVWVWGENQFGQLGIDPASEKTIHVPQCLNNSSTFDPVLATHEIIKIYCGWTHMVARTGSSMVINWGRNNYGQLGCEESVRPKPWKPELVDDLSGTLSMAVGAEHNLSLTASGTAFSWGWNEHGNCGVGKNRNLFEVTEINIQESQRVLLLGAGSGYSFALIEN